MNPSFMAQLGVIIDARLGAAMEELKDIAKEKVGEPYPPASAPGEPPHKRTGGLQRAIFTERLGPMDWALGVNQVEPDPERGIDRSDLGLWLELGTGHARSPFPTGTTSTRTPREGEDTTRKGNKTSMAPRPYLVSTVVEDGPGVVQSHLGGGA